MTEHKHPDDGKYILPGPITIQLDTSYDRDRFEAAKTFAAAWLPIVTNTTQHADLDGSTANELGLLMADDLIRRLRENA